MIPLTNEQRKFFQFLKDNHRCMGYTGTIPDILKDDAYDEAERDYLNDIVKVWKRHRTDARVMNSYGGLPTKYLK